MILIKRTARLSVRMRKPAGELFADRWGEGTHVLPVKRRILPSCKAYESPKDTMSPVVVDGETLHLKSRRMCPREMIPRQRDNTRVPERQLIHHETDDFSYDSLRILLRLTFIALTEECSSKDPETSISAVFRSKILILLGESSSGLRFRR